MSDLTTTEQGNLRAALRFLRVRLGTWATVAKAIKINTATLTNLVSADAVSVRVAFLVARFAKVPVDDLLAGKYPAAGTCPHCGQRRDPGFDLSA